MKTVEQAAQEYAKSLNLKGHDSFDFETYAKQDFKAGVEFAQRWISVDEEMPEIEKLVQVKIQEISSDKIIYDHDRIMPQEPFNMFECEQCAVKVTHWRPIELE